MDGASESVPDCEDVQYDSFPAGLSAGSTVLIAGTVDPASYGVSLRAIHQFGDGDDTAFVVTTTESVDETVVRYEALCEDSDGPSLGFVETTSERRSISALYERYPVVYVPAPGDLERIVIGLSDLTGIRPPSSGTRHLVIRSLTPLLEHASTDDVCTILERISGLRMGSGLTLFGLDYTAHDDETMAALTEFVDAIVWVTKQSNVLEFEYARAANRYDHPVNGGNSDD